MKSPQRVMWSEGLLMSPQHLQQQDLYHEQLLFTRLDAIEPLSWGLLRCRLDRRALSAGQLQVEELALVLPGGTVLSVASGDAELPPSRAIEGHFPHSRAALEVFVGIPKEREGMANYSAEIGAPRVRYRPTVRSVPDLTGQGEAADLQFARRNVSILFGDENRDDFESIKIAEIVRDDGGSLIVSDPYIPPILRVGASPFLIAGARRVLRLMAQRRRALSEANRERGDRAIEYNASDVTRFLLLNTINTYTPGLNYLVESQDMHPRDAFLLLSQFAGALATFSVDFDPAQLPSFMFTDLRPTFEELFARITALLQATVKEHYVAMPLEARSDGMHIGQLQDDRFFGSERCFIGVKAEVGEGEVATQLSRLSKVASWGDINGILSAATPGAAVEVAYRPPPEIPIKAGVVYFSVSTDNVYWRNIAAERKIAVYLPRPFEPETTSIELLAIPRATV